MYLDSCIIVKLVSHEPDSEANHRQVTGNPVMTSELAVTEVRSALLTKERMGRLSRQDRLTGWHLFQEKVRDGEFVLLPLNRQLIERAGAVIDQFHSCVALGTLDAIHVAPAELNGDEQLCSGDERVRKASDVLGLLFAALPEGK